MTFVNLKKCIKHKRSFYLNVFLFKCLLVITYNVKIIIIGIFLTTTYIKAFYIFNV